ncbi:methylenetetrahydrofolate reductase C-terminal domain-containing protein [Candidatus Aerophobetes bacterium]|nr:methylenetetrahydrofolate reductase C-terminal domain-containing protein [Candidatus Aerophobetes bacterium]
MIITEQKRFEEIDKFLSFHSSVFICGCSECATLCKTGGEEEVKEMKEKLEKTGKTVAGWVILEPACHRLNDMKFFREHKKEIDLSDAILILACGNGTQTVAGILEKPVYPGCNSLFLGEIVRFGNFEERCQMCGECILDITGGICPVTRCSKSLLNGPCGGSENGKCEIDPEIECGWQMIIDKLKNMGRLDTLRSIILPKDWSSSRDGGPRKFNITKATTASDSKENLLEEKIEIEKMEKIASSTPDSKLEKILREEKFALTCELGPPKGADPKPVETKAKLLKGFADAVNITDNQTAITRMSSIACAAILLQFGIEPVVQVVTRDRNRLAIQSDILGACGLGVRNFLCLSGDHQKFGNHPQAKNVYDVDSVQLIFALNRMRSEGKFLSGDKLSSPPSVFIGAVENPFADPFEFRAIRLAKKIAAGCDFIQTQAVFDVEKFEKWMSILKDEGVSDKVYILAGVIPIKSVGMARYMRDYVSGVSVPDEVVARMEDAKDPKKEGIKLCVELINRLRETDGVKGVHIMAVAWEEVVPQIVEEANLLPRPG